jgi:hypothetical protein
MHTPRKNPHIKTPAKCDAHIFKIESAEIDSLALSRSFSRTR